MIKFVKLALLAIGVVSATHLNAQDEVLLQYNMKPGMAYDYEMGIEGTIKMGDGTKDQSVEVDMEFLTDLVVSCEEPTSPDLTYLKYKYEDVRMSMSVMGQQMTFDSRTGENTMGETGMMLEMVVGMELGFEYQRNGIIENVHGIDRIMDNMLDEIGVPEDQKEAVREMVSQEMDEESFKADLSNTTLTFPKEAIGVGDTWQDTTVSDMNGIPITAYNTYTLLEIREDEVLIQIDGVLTGEGGMAPFGSANTKMSGISDGVYAVSIETGIPTSGTLNMKLNSNSEFDTENKEAPDSMKMQIDMVVKLEATPVEG